MHLGTSVANILNKFNNQPINILYSPQYNMFDMLLGLVSDNIYVADDRISTLNNNSIKVLKNNQIDLFSYNVGITNSIFQYTSNKYFNNLHINGIILTHSNKPNQIKKEDSLLMNQNLEKEYKIFFTQKIASSWRLSNSIVVPYGIPLHLFNIDENINRKPNTVLLINYERMPNINALKQLLETNGIKVDISSEINFNPKDVKKLFNQYKVCIDISEHNISNLLCSIACGCNAITYATPMIMENFINTPNLYTAKSVEDLINVIKKIFEKETTDDFTEYFDKNYNFGLMKDKLSTIIKKCNQEAFVL